MARSMVLFIGEVHTPTLVSFLRSAWVGWAKDREEAELVLKEGERLIFMGDLEALVNSNLTTCLIGPPGSWVALVPTVDEAIELAQEEESVDLIFHPPGMDGIKRISEAAPGVCLVGDLGRGDTATIGKRIFDLLQIPCAS